MRPILMVTALMAVLIAGCGPELVGGPEQTEPGRVSKLIYVPSGHGSDLAVGFNTGKGGGMTFTPVDIDIPARYGIVFECLHGSFAVEGSKWMSLWKSLREGQVVTIRYREVYELERATGDKRFVKLDFLGASPVPAVEGTPARSPAPVGGVEKQTPRDG